MKKIFLFITMALMIGLVTSSFTLPDASPPSGIVQTIATDTIQGAETVNFTAARLTGSYSSTVIQATCTELGGTSDGTLILKGSIDGTSYLTLTDENGIIKGYPNDTLTITDGATVQWVISETPYSYYQVQGAGTTGDTTLVTVKLLYKK